MQNAFEGLLSGPRRQKGGDRKAYRRVKKMLAIMAVELRELGC